MNRLDLKLNGKKYGFTFGLGFLGELLEELDFDLEMLLTKLDKNPFKYYPLVVYTSARYHCELENKEVDFDLKEIVEAIDKEGAFTDKNEPIIKFIKAFKQSIFKDVPVEDIEVNDAEEVKPDDEKK